VISGDLFIIIFRCLVSRPSANWRNPSGDLFIVFRFAIFSFLAYQRPSIVALR
jgi:hypothetical protein